MNYRNRILEPKLAYLSRHFPVIVVTGARQVGKSTLLAHVFGNSARHFIFDPVTDELGVRRDPAFFLQQHQTPLILDEIQYAPELLPVIKKRVDQDPRPGQFFLSGSQNLSVIRSIGESLAGRAVIVDLETMTLRERRGAAQQGAPFWLETILNSGKEVQTVETLPSSPAPEPQGLSLFDMLWRGGFPGTLDLPDDLLPDFFRSYVRTYVERDIRILAGPSDQQTFSRFFGLMGTLSAQEINHSHLGRELGVTPQTASRWLELLKATFQWFELPPYHGNRIKRLSGKGKGYLTDTGLLCHLSRISSPEALAVQPILGAIFETHVVLEIRRRLALLPTPANLYHWRAHSGAEADLVLERDGILWPVEIKAKSAIRPSDVRGLRSFREAYPDRSGPGIVVAGVDKPYLYSPEILVLPYTLG